LIFCLFVPIEENINILYRTNCSFSYCRQVDFDLVIICSDKNKI